MVLFQEWHIMDHHGTSAHPVPDTVVQMLEAPLRDSRQGLHRLRVQWTFGHQSMCHRQPLLQPVERSLPRRRWNMRSAQMVCLDAECLLRAWKSMNFILWISWNLKRIRNLKFTHAEDCISLKFLGWDSSVQFHSVSWWLILWQNATTNMRKLDMKETFLVPCHICHWRNMGCTGSPSEARAISPQWEGFCSLWPKATPSRAWCKMSAQILSLRKFHDVSLLKATEEQSEENNVSNVRKTTH